MELNVTAAFRAIDPGMIFNSPANLGADAAKITWDNAMRAAADAGPLHTAEQREAFRQYVRGFGAWNADEIAAWTPLELNALALQCLAAEMREGGLDTGGTWEEYAALSQTGQCSGALFRGGDGQIYFSMEG